MKLEGVVVTSGMWTALAAAGLSAVTVTFAVVCLNIKDVSIIGEVIVFCPVIFEAPTLRTISAAPPGSGSPIARAAAIVAGVIVALLVAFRLIAPKIGMSLNVQTPAIVLAPAESKKLEFAPASGSVTVLAADGLVQLIVVL